MLIAIINVFEQYCKTAKYTLLNFFDRVTFMADPKNCVILLNIPKYCIATGDPCGFLFIYHHRCTRNKQRAELRQQDRKAKIALITALKDTVNEITHNISKTFKKTHELNLDAI